MLLCFDIFDPGLSLVVAGVNGFVGEVATRVASRRLKLNFPPAVESISTPPLNLGRNHRHLRPPSQTRPTTTEELCTLVKLAFHCDYLLPLKAPLEIDRGRNHPHQTSSLPPAVSSRPQIENNLHSTSTKIDDNPQGSSANLECNPTYEMPAIRIRKDHGPYSRECARLSQVALPYRIQHTLLTAIQKILEEAIFHFVRQWCPGLLQQRGWDTPEAGELNTWWSVLCASFNTSIPPTATQFHRTHISELFGRLSHLRHASVHRKVTSIECIKRMMIDAVELADGFKDFPRRNKLRCIELAIYNGDLENLQRITQKPLEAFVDFNYPGCPPGSVYDTARRATPPALEVPRAPRATVMAMAMAPMAQLEEFAPAGSGPAPAPVGKKSRSQKKNGLPSLHHPAPCMRGRSPDSHPASNTRSQVRTRDRLAPYPTGLFRDLLKKARSSVSHLIDLTGDSMVDLGPIGESKNNPVDLTTDSKKNVDKARSKTVKDSQPQKVEQNLVQAYDLPAQQLLSAIQAFAPHPDINVQSPIRPQYSSGEDPFSGDQDFIPLVDGEVAAATSSFGSGKDTSFSANNAAQAQPPSSLFSQPQQQQQPQAGIGFGDFVGGAGLFSQKQAKLAGDFFAAVNTTTSASDGLSGDGIQQPAATGGLSVPNMGRQRLNPRANSVEVNEASGNPQMAQEQPFFRQFISLAKRAPNAVLSRWRTPSPLPEVSPQVPGAFPLSSPAKVTYHFKESYRTRLKSPDESD